MKNIKTTNELKSIIEEYADQINAPKDIRPDYGVGKRDSVYVVRSTDTHYYCAIYERGSEWHPFQTQDLTEFLFKIFWSITFSMGSDFWEKTKDRAVSDRRYIFYKQLELMKVLGQDLYDLCKDDILATLEKHPFRDEYPNTLEFFEEYYQKQKQD